MSLSRRRRSPLGVERLEARDVPTALLALGRDDNILYRFDSATPGTIQSVALITGLQPGELIRGIDYRPRTGQLFAMGIVDGTTTDTVRTYTLNPLTGAATLI